MQWLHPQPSMACRRAFALFLVLVPLAAGVQAQDPSHQQNPTVTFTSRGDHIVTLTACNAAGLCNSMMKTVTVLDPRPQIVSLTNPPVLVGVNQAITVQDTATGRPNLTHKWTFSLAVPTIPPTPDTVVTGNPATWTPTNAGIYLAHLEVSTPVSADGTASSTPVAVTVVPFTFSDVPPTYWAWHFIEGLQAAGVPTYCSGSGAFPPLFCPDSAMTRGDMAIFLLRSKEVGTVPSYTPPACTTPVFADVPCSDPRAPWINELVRRGVTAGCGGGNYCPSSPVTRDQMAVFLLVTAGIAPDTTCPPAPFTDEPCTSSFEPWVKKLVSLGVTAGCGNGAYCAQSTVSRAQMSVFLSVMFHIPQV